MTVLNNKWLLALAIAFTGVCIFYFAGQSSDEAQQKPSQESSASSTLQALDNGDDEALPDYRHEVHPSTVEQTVEVDFDADALLAQAEQGTQLMIEEYNQVLDDPEQRERIEADYKESGEDVKKALLAKMKRGEL
ncbi:hypothetical protein [Echinimonas agarilytica]|uniref:Uncharacterized protein n=1 Tax=Echinimonas agarilytica TaxID=1215918 RepID=A0AA41W576_9GAMM|nr:hypothetical protein [Echinimonas agarilytica]MCM2679182.1 hypothetical protein [Echinimonas agarilytica]